jgi:hypothetical protein
MNKLLKDYLKAIYFYEDVWVTQFDVEGDSCATWFKQAENEIEKKVINIWDLLVFVNNKIDDKE